MNFYYIDGAKLNIVKLDGDHEDWDSADQYAQSIGLNYIHIVDEHQLRDWQKTIEALLPATHLLTVLPAGTYYVGDPCYVVPDEDWMECLEETGYLGLYDFYEYRNDHTVDRPYNKDRVGMFQFKGHYLGASGTAHGDGCYRGDDGNTYGVDAGMIGAVHIDYVRDQGEALRCGAIHNFEEPFTIHYEEDGGTIVIGDIRIKTDWDDDEEDACEYCGSTDCYGYGDCQEEDDDSDSDAD